MDILINNAMDRVTLPYLLPLRVIYTSCQPMAIHRLGI